MFTDLWFGGISLSSSRLEWLQEQTALHTQSLGTLRAGHHTSEVASMRSLLIGIDKAPKIHLDSFKTGT